MTDQAIRNYLTVLEDPQKLVDKDAVAKASQAIHATNDPIERLKLRSELAALQEVPTDEIEAAFIEAVKGWAEKNHIAPKALLDEGVPAKVLQNAGIDLNGHTPAPAKAKKKATRKRTKRTATTSVKSSASTPVEGGGATKADAVKGFLADLKEPFTIPTVIDATGASRSTVKKVLEAAIEDGQIATTDESRSSGRGRSATVYAPAS